MVQRIEPSWARRGGWARRCHITIEKEPTPDLPWDRRRVRIRGPSMEKVNHAEHLVREVPAQRGLRRQDHLK